MLLGLVLLERVPESRCVMAERLRKVMVEIMNLIIKRARADCEGNIHFRATVSGTPRYGIWVRYFIVIYYLLFCTNTCDVMLPCNLGKYCNCILFHSKLPIQLLATVPYSSSNS